MNNRHDVRRKKVTHKSAMRKQQTRAPLGYAILMPAYVPVRSDVIPAMA